MSAAWRAAQGGADVVLVERTQVLGGKLRTHEVDGLVLEAGAESLLARRPESRAVVDAAGLGNRLVHPSTTGASVWTDRLHPLPKQQLLGIPCDVHDPDLPGLLDRAALDRLAHEPPVDAVPDDTSVGQLVEQQLGRDVVELLVEPLLGGVYAGRADDISLDAALPGLLDRVRTTGSLVRAAAQTRTATSSDGPVFASVVGGLGALPEAVADHMDAQVRRGSAVVALDRRDDRWVVTLEDGAELESDAVVVALPGFAAAPLLEGWARAASTVAAELEYASVALVTTVFDRSAVHAELAGTGFLVPPRTGRLTKAATFVSRKWQWVDESAPDREVLRFSVGRMGDTRGLDRDDDELVAAVLSETAPLLALAVAPRATAVTRWEQSLPQYRPGHRARVATARAALPPGLAVCGATWDGVGIPACIASGWSAADQVVPTSSGGGTMGR